MRIGSFICLFAYVITAALAASYVEEFRMPGVRTEVDDAYLCTSKKVSGKGEYITAFKPIHDEEVTHHMIIFGCNVPGSNKKMWKCSEDIPVCLGEPSIIFSWAMNAPSFQLPPDTSFPLVPEVYKYLVLQVHYKDKKAFDDNPDKRDTSGLNLTVQTEPTANLAGVYTFIGDGTVAPYGTTMIRVGCQYTGTATLHPFAFRVHAHGHGRMNDAYLERDGKSYLIGAKSPQEKQTFYPIENKNLEIYPDDYLSARCNMTNNEGRAIHMGSTRKDEMCNFYLMYSVKLEDAQQLLDNDNKQCVPISLSILDELEPELQPLLDYFENDLDELDY